MCDCIEKHENNMLAHLQKEHEATFQYNPTLNGFFGEGMQPQSLNLAAGTHITGVEFVATRRQKKRDGTLGVEKKHRVTIWANYCPFCGEKYEKGGSDE